jgi:hypothetical protein
MISSLFVLLLATTDPATCPMHAQHMSEAAHGAEVDTRHDEFGMPHDGVRHSFKLRSNGGVIELQSIETDAKTIAAIREHLRSVTKDFDAGNFEKPLFVHGKMPDGVDGMRQRRAAIAYSFHELERGGEIRIATKDAAALSAIHEFLRFQISDHRTGDSGLIEEAK